MEVKFDYTEEHDILSMCLGEEVDYSEEITSSEGHEFVIDYDKKGRIVGIEIMNWNLGRKVGGKRK